MASSEDRGSISRRMIVVFLSTFTLTSLGFIGATLALRSKAERIMADSSAITGNAVPSIQRLSGARTMLRHLEVTLDDYVGHSVRTPGVEPEPASVAENRSALRDDWAAYTALPTFVEERAMWPAITSQFRELDLALDALLANLKAGNTANLEDGWDTDTKRLFDQLDDRLYDEAVLNAAGSAYAAADIGAIERDLRTISAVLAVLCALFTLLAGYVAVRLFRQYTGMTEDQIENLELFSGRVAHDLRGPLSSVSLAVQFAHEKVTDPKTKSTLSRAYRTLQRTGELVDGLLLLAQLIRSPTPAMRSDVRSVLEDVIEELQPLARDKQIELHLEHVAPVQVACSSGVLANMINNLVGNSIKHMGDSAVRRVTVNAETRGEDVRIEVRDTGPGIPGPTQGIVFDVYTRAAPAEISGLGLGLATVRRLVEVLGGRIGLDSRAGSGSLFWIELPKARADSVDGAASRRRFGAESTSNA